MDLLRIIGCLACSFTRWTKYCDKRLHRLVEYIDSSIDFVQVGWIADKADDLQAVLAADADLAGHVPTAKSTTGVFLSIRGPKSFWPVTGISKRQGCVSTSTPEAYIVSTSHALRIIGLPGLELWQRLLPKQKQMRFL